MVEQAADRLLSTDWPECVFFFLPVESCVSLARVFLDNRLLFDSSACDDCRFGDKLIIGGLLF